MLPLLRCVWMHAININVLKLYKFLGIWYVLLWCYYVFPVTLKSLLWFYYCFTLMLLQKWASWKGLYQAFWTADTPANDKVKAALPMLQTSNSHWLGHRGRRFPPKMSDQNHFFPLLPSLIIVFLLLTLWRSVWFFVLLALAWKDNAIGHVSQPTARGEWYSTFPITVGCAMILVILSFCQCLSFST